MRTLSVLSPRVFRIYSFVRARNRERREEEGGRSSLYRPPRPFLFFPCLLLLSLTHRPQVTGIDIKHCRDHIEQNPLVRRHVEHLRRTKALRGAFVVFVPEHGTGFSHTRFQECVEDLPRVRTLYQNGDSRPGIRKDPHVTKGYAHALIDAFDAGDLVFMRRWFTDSVGNLPGGQKTRASLLNELKEELLRYGYDEKGKLTGKFGVHQDDMVIALAMLLYWSTAVENPTTGNPYAHLRDSSFFEASRAGSRRLATAGRY